ncbi:MAG: hypothetical protein KBT33_11605, partial [Prevotellaceae bacterium]|nr:hypothetical protein [Candidatus Minthosoma equi]
MTNFGKTGGMLSKAFALFFVMTLMGSGEACAQSILGALKNKVEQKVKEKINSKVEEKVDETVNGKKNKKNKNSDAADDTPAAAAGEQTKSDFVPGAVTLFEDKVTGEQVGEFPSKWNLIEGNCEVSKLGGETVISLPPATTQDEYVDSQIQPLMKEIYNYLPEEYTIEF